MMGNDRDRANLLCLGLLVFLSLPRNVSAQNEIVTVPLVLADYYGWAYTEAFEDHANIYGWTTAAVDALGWTLVLTSRDQAGLFLINVAGIAKTVYPVAALLGASDTNVRQRAWIALGTHTVTLLTLEILGKPAISIQSSLGPRQDGLGMVLAFKF
jgi:hypothetical protein